MVGGAGRPGRIVAGSSSPVGRETTIGKIVDALARAAAVDLVGEPGIGKTTVWRAAARAAPAAQRIELTCQAAESDFGLAVVADLLRSATHDDTLSRLSPLPRQVIDVITRNKPADTVAVPLDAHLVGVTLLSVLTARRNERVLIAIDDLQWCDADSFAAIRFAYRRSTGSDICWLTARRPETSNVLPDAVSIAVAPLPAPSLRQLITEHLGIRLSLPTAAAVVDASGGNPLYALEIARTLPRAAGPDDVHLPPSLRQLIATRIIQLSEQTRSDLVDLAIAGGSTDTPAASLDAAFTAGIVEIAGGATRFTHPLLAAGVIELTPPAALADAYRRAAAAADNAVSVARLLAQSNPPPSADLALKLADAADLTGGRGDRHGAAWLSARALDLEPDGRQSNQVLATAARWAALTYSPNAVALAQRLVAVSEPGPARSAALLQLGEAVVSQDVQAALDAARDAADQPNLPDSCRAAALSDAGVLLVILGRQRDAAETLTAALATVTPDTAAWSRLVASAGMARRVVGLPVDEALLRNAVDFARRHQVAPSDNPLVNAGVVAMWDDRHELARACFVEAAAQFDGTGFDDDARFHLAELDIRVGMLADAERAARKLVDTTDGQELSGNAYVLAMAAAWLGDEATCRRAAQQALDIAASIGEQLFWIGATVALGFLDLTLRRVDHALTGLTKAAQALQGQGFLEPSCFPALPIAVEAAAAAGDLELGRGLLADLDAAAETLHSHWARAGAARARGHLADAAGDTLTAIDCFTRATDAYEALGLTLEHARTLHARGVANRRAGQRTAARADLQQAEVAFATAGAQILQRSAAEELRRLGGRQPSDPSQLTESERQVVEHVVAGASNTQTAAAMHLSVKTVEAHLSRAYTKLGVHSRVELANTYRTRDNQ
jgi:DNA-binding CsgD family transcriptional regulator